MNSSSKNHRIAAIWVIFFHIEFPWSIYSILLGCQPLICEISYKSFVDWKVDPPLTATQVCMAVDSPLADPSDISTQIVRTADDVPWKKRAVGKGGSLKGVPVDVFFLQELTALCSKFNPTDTGFLNCTCLKLFFLKHSCSQSQVLICFIACVSETNTKNSCPTMVGAILQGFVAGIGWSSQGKPWYFVASSNSPLLTKMSFFLRILAGCSGFGFSIFTSWLILLLFFLAPSARYL